MRSCGSSKRLVSFISPAHRRTDRTRSNLLILPVSLLRVFLVRLEIEAHQDIIVVYGCIS
jgi:hypothetical protein